jgi:hypothetical protein
VVRGHGIGYAGLVAQTSGGPALQSPRARAVLAALAAALGGGLLADCGGGSPTGPSSPPAAHLDATVPAGAAIVVVSGETAKPVPGARVTLGGRVHTTDGEGRVVLPAAVSLPAPLEIDGAGFLLRRTSLREASPGPVALWPGHSPTGLDTDSTGWLVYTSATSHDAPHGGLALHRPSHSARTAHVLPSEELRRDPLALAAHEEAVRMLNDVLGDRFAYALAAPPAGGLVFETRLDPKSAHCKDRVRAVTTTSVRGSEITGGTVTFCSLEAARSFTVAHELGHTFGLQHSAHGADIMYGWFVPHHPAGFSPREALAMRLMLQREPGNRFPDTDPAAASSGERRTRVTVCR